MARIVDREEWTATWDPDTDLTIALTYEEAASLRRLLEVAVGLGDQVPPGRGEQRLAFELVNAFPLLPER